MAVLTAAARKKIPAKKFAGPKTRSFPLEDKAHIRNARARERFASPAEKARIDAAAKREGIGKPAAKAKKAAKKK